MIHEFSFPTRIRCGVGVSRELGSHLQALGSLRPLIVSDAGVAALPFARELGEQLATAGLAVACYSDFSGNPIKAHVEAGVLAARNHAADALVLLGGGAALDVGKAIALMLHHPGDLFAYEDGPNALPVDQEIPPVIAVPTTAGTGSEVGRSSVISDDETKAKKIIFSPRLLPRLVLADPKLTVALPAGITAATGMDALTHLVEAYVAKGYHPMAQGIAWQGVAMVAKSLVTCVKRPDDIEARTTMLLASLMGAVAFQKGLGVIHSCAHALSTCFDLHHGLANALMLEAGLRFNLPTVTQDYGQLALAVGIVAESPAERAEAFIAWVAALRQQVGIESGLAARGVRIHDDLLTVACADVCHPSNPRAVSRQDFADLYAAAM